jgi:flagellar protein FlaG
MVFPLTGVANGYQTQDSIGERPIISNGQTNVVEERSRPVALTAADIDATTKDLERITLAFNKKLKFEIDGNLDELIVKVIDPETDKVIKELPPKELQRLRLKIKEMIGLLYDEVV